MRLKSQRQFHTEGAITAEIAICSAVIILLFALFISIAGYIRTYDAVKEFIDRKAMDTAVLGYAAGIDIPGIISSDGLFCKGHSGIRNLIIYSESWGEEVRLNGSYTYVSPIGGFRVRMSSYFTKWKGDAPEEGKSIWDLPPAERGKKLEEIFGGGLPEFFPVLDAYDDISGHAAVIVSIDTTLERYKKGPALKETINDKINDLVTFCHGECEGDVITGMDIDTRELII
ncbi:MAG: hypothetical protein R3232_09025, partial [Clostridia bacterium]|nr:hypothetical protein [Clostridia bacterium]